MSKHRFLTHSFATDVATRSLAHRALSLALTRTLSVAFVGASITLLAACGSTAADLAEKQAADRLAKEQARDAARSKLRPANFGPPVSLPSDPGNVALSALTPYASEGDESQETSLKPFTATGITIASRKGVGKDPEKQGVSENINVAQTTVTGGYDFANLKLSRFSPTPVGSERSNDVPFLLIWQFADAETTGGKGGDSWRDRVDDRYTDPSPGGADETRANAAKLKGNGKFVAPGIDGFRYQPPEADGDDQFENVPVPGSRAAYLEQMLEDFKPHNVIDDGAPLQYSGGDENHRPIPYAKITRAPAPGGHMSRILLKGSSTFWADAVDAAALKEEEDTTEDGNIPAYDVELIFPKRYSTDWGLQYSGFILMRAFYTGGSLATTDTPQSYINLFTYTNSEQATDTRTIVEAFYDNSENVGKQARADYSSLFSGWGVAAQNPNEHHYLYDSDFIITAIFNDGGGGTLSATINPRVRKTGGDTISKDSDLTGGDYWGGSGDGQRKIVINGIKWSGYTGEGVVFTGDAIVQTKDGTVVSAYNTDNEGNFKGTFAGRNAEELVAEMKLKSSEDDEPTVIGGVSGQRYQPLSATTP